MVRYTPQFHIVFRGGFVVETQISLRKICVNVGGGVDEK